MKKIKIYTFSHKRPDFLKIQYDSMRMFIKDVEFDFIVFNNATADNDAGKLANHIQSICEDLEISSIRIEKDKELLDSLFNSYGEDIFDKRNGYYINVPLACAYSLCWAWKHFIHKEESPVFVIDSDMFFTSDTYFSKLFNYDLCYVPQERDGLDVPYIWNGVFFANLPSLINPGELNWFCGKYNNIPVDVGGQTIEYLKKYSVDLKNKNIDCQHIPYDDNCDFYPANYELLKIPENKMPTIIHYRGGSNWNQMSDEYHVKKTQWIKNKVYGK